MMRWTIIAALAAGPIWAEPTVERTGSTGNGDTMRMEMQGANGVLTYDNSADMASAPGSWPIASGDASCMVRVVVGDAETVRVTCDPPFYAEPDVAEIEDGDSFDFTIMLVAF